MNIQFTTQQIIDIFNDTYSLEVSSRCRFLERGFNDNYLIGSGSDWYIFRVYLNNKYYIESFDDFRFELDLLEHLHTNDLPVAPAVRNRHNNLLGEIETKSGTRAFALFPYRPGDSITRDAMTPELIFQLGATFAQTHLVANGFQSAYRRYNLDLNLMVHEPLKHIKKEIQQGDDKISERRREEYRELITSLEPIEELTDMVESLEITSDEFGIIHGDLHPGNILLNNNQFTVLDFDHSAYGWRAYDLWIAQFLPEPYGRELVAGYESVRPLSNAEKDLLPVFSKLRRLWDAGDSIAIEPALGRPES